MEYISVAEAAGKWQLALSTVRKYCAQGRIPGCLRNGRSWQIPSTAESPENGNYRANDLLSRLLAEMESRMPGGIYHRIQIDLTYNSNHMEGSCLNPEQTRHIFETKSLCPGSAFLPVDDIIETCNHFRCIDWIIANAKRQLSEKNIRHLHFLLKSGTQESLKSWFGTGDYKRLPNEVGGAATTAPELVSGEMKKLLSWYEGLASKDLESLIEFHVRFERIHPFQDGNGRIGRLILFKECLRFGLVPFIIDEEHKFFYYRGLKMWADDHGYLNDTCLSAQDKFRKVLEYFRIRH